MADWKDIVKSVAPALATGLGGPLLGGVVSILADKVLGGSTGDPVADEAKLAGVLNGGLTPELKAQVLAAEQVFKTETLRVNADIEKAYIADTADARHSHAGDKHVLWLGLLINAASYVTTGAVLYGCFAVLSNSGKLAVDPGIAAAVGGIVGAVVQWLFSNAAQANGFFFGSSPGSRQMARDLGQAVGQGVQAQGKSKAS